MDVLKYPMLMLPATKNYLWGGERLRRRYGKAPDGSGPLAESWELSCHPDGPSVIGSGMFTGETLSDYIGLCPDSILGSRHAGKRELPILVKLIDAAEPLSIQVHPDEEYANRVEGGHGKAELWVVLECDEGAELVCGVNRALPPEEFKRRIADGTLGEALARVPVKPWDVLYVAPGMIHAIGGGILLAEVQQNSNLTYRIWDYGRVGADGLPRELHVEQALAVARLKPVSEKCESMVLASGDAWTLDRLFASELFRVRRLRLHSGVYAGNAGGDSFLGMLCLGDNMKLTWRGGALLLRKGWTVFLPAGLGAFTFGGNGDALLID